jgi:hypothetical protein
MFYRLFAINALPCILAGIVWWIRLRDLYCLTNRRRVAFVAALVLNSVSSVSLMTLISWLAFGAGRPFGGVVEDRLFLSMIALTLFSAGLAVFGKGVSRGLLIANGSLVALQWWLLAALGI